MRRERDGEKKSRKGKGGDSERERHCNVSNLKGERKLQNSCNPKKFVHSHVVYKKYVEDNLYNLYLSQLGCYLSMMSDEYDNITFLCIFLVGN